MHIIGTAGHVDHGKSSLVQALTGTNPDRWREEQLRGMTLDLGFAHLRFDDGIEAGIVDVPGHERFLHNMLAGAAGMELLLLVIAANEGIMPQTVEHLQILRYLNVRETIVVVTKSDLIPAEQLEGICARLQGDLQGTLAACAPLIPVCATSGYHMDVLREAIHHALQRLPSRDAQAPAYLPIDRVFALPGHGTVVTGTLMQGSIRTGETLRLEPLGKNVRVRSLQSFGTARDAVEGGARVAVNLPGVDVAQISRGEMLVAAQFAPAESFAVRFACVPEALPILRRRNAVRAYIGSAEILGTLVFEHPPASEEEVSAQLFLRRASVAYPGCAFVLRRLSPKTLLGGGRIEGNAGAQGAQAAADPQEAAVLGVLAAHAPLPMAPDAIAREANLREEVANALLEALCERGAAALVERPRAYLDGAAAAALHERVRIHLAQRQSQEPWLAGLTSLALARALQVEETLLVRVLDALAREGRLARHAGYYATTDHVPTLSQEQRGFFDEVLAQNDAQPLAPAGLADVVRCVKQSRIRGVSQAFDMLLAKGALVKVNDDLYRGAQIAQIHARLESYVNSRGSMTMAQFRDLIGTTRKYAVPLLEWFDARGITVRSGDVRMLRAKRIT